MKININLSSDPFRRDRPWVVATTAVSVFLLFSFGILVYLAVMGRDVAMEARAEVQKAQIQATLLHTEKGKMEGVLRRPENGEVIERSVFLNKLLLRKSISWTRIFSDLEKVVPYNVRLIQIRPAVTPQNEVFLEMVVGAQSPEPVVDMLMRLEAAPEFGATFMANWLPPSQTEPLYRYRINVNYAQKL